MAIMMPVADQHHSQDGVAGRKRYHDQAIEADEQQGLAGRRLAAIIGVDHQRLAHVYNAAGQHIERFQRILFQIVLESMCCVARVILSWSSSSSKIMPVSN